MKGKNENHPRGAGGTLQMKIIAGHLLLVLLVGGIIGTVWYEHRMLRRAGKAERTMLEQQAVEHRFQKPDSHVPGQRAPAAPRQG